MEATLGLAVVQTLEVSCEGISLRLSPSTFIQISREIVISEKSPKLVKVIHGRGDGNSSISNSLYGLPPFSNSMLQITREDSLLSGQCSIVTSSFLRCSVKILRLEYTTFHYIPQNLPRPSWQHLYPPPRI